MSAKSYLACSVFAVSMALTGAASAAENLTVAAFGGEYQKQTREAWFQPAADKLGVTLSMDTIGTVANLRAHVQGGATNWDVVLIAGSSCAAAASEKLIEPLDYKVINTDGIPPHMVTERTIGVLQYSTVLAWNKKAMKGEEPKNWADFWDTKKFPGPRGFDARPTFSLEIALMADGVPPAQLYPLDVERAFRKIGAFRPNIQAYYSNGAVAVQLLKDGEVDMMPLFENRVYELIRDGVPLGFTLNQAIVDINCLVIPRGTPKRDLAMRFIAEVVKPEINSRIALTSDMSPTNMKAFTLNLIAPERARTLSSLPANMTNQVLLNADWWTPNLNELGQRYKALISGR
jgi:putative spermidine/putrescine transport system substrate-binding protein